MGAVHQHNGVKKIYEVALFFLCIKLKLQLTISRVHIDKFLIRTPYIRVGYNGLIKVENILKGRLDSVPSPTPSVKIQIMGGKVCLRCKGKTLLGIVNKLWKTKILLTSPSNVLPYYLK